MDLDPVLLSRFQFAWLIGWHILMPAFTVGMASYIALLEGLHLSTGRQVYLRISMFWIRIFSVAFGVGVVSGVIMPFQFGTNWSRFADATSNVLGPLFAYEGIMAFFLEAAFLGVLLFGRKLVPPWAHFIAALMVALGTLFSAFWILAANSWMQTPAGYEIVDGRFFPKDWLAVVFSPSFPYRLGHTVVGFFVTTGLVVTGIAAYLIRKGQSVDEARVMLSMTLWLLTVQVNRFAIDVPRLGSLILTHSLDGEVKGLKSFRPEDRPPVAIPFFAFRIMVGIGGLMLALVAASWWLRYIGRLFDSALFLRACIAMTPLGFVAVLAGWTTTEVGRQPWTVYGLMRTVDSVPPSLTGAAALATLLAYMAVYLVIFPSGFYVMARLIHKGPAAATHTGAPIEGGRSSAPAQVELHAEGKSL